MFVKPVRIATCCPAMGILNEHMRFSSTGRGPMNYSGSLITLNSWPHADLIFGLELLSKPMFLSESKRRHSSSCIKDFGSGVSSCESKQVKSYDACKFSEQSVCWHRITVLRYLVFQYYNQLSIPSP